MESMTTTTRFISMAAAVLAAAIMTACAGSDELTDTPQQPENQNRVITLTTTVGLGGGAADAGAEASGASATTRALTSDGVKTFKAGETMALVYRSMSKRTVVVPSEALTDDDIVITGDPDTDKKSATFTFNLTEEPDKSSSVYYIYPAAMADADGNENYEALCTEQDGTLAKLASNFDFATTHNNLDWDGDNLPGATLENQLAILAITLKDDVTGADITSSITSLILSVDDGTYTYNVSRSAAPGPIYVAILPTRNATIDVTATGGGYTYTKTLTYKIYQASKGYNVSWRMTNMNTTPLTMEALTAGKIVVRDSKPGMQYSLNGGEKIAMAKTAMDEFTYIDVIAGDKVQFYGDGQDITCYNGTSIAGWATVKVYGNIMSLVDEFGFATATTLPEENTFSHLFSSNDNLTDASGLLLPATALEYNCYEEMFSGCTSLTAAPALPATTLAEECYGRMFFGCTSLETAPALPATTLADNCYDRMFSGCSSLTAAPALPATTLHLSCYFSMFSGCSSLTTAPALPATTLATSCYFGMFDGCTNLTTAPALPAETLAPSCYFAMFNGCTKLNAVTCLATDISATGCTTNWLYNAGAQAEGTKTFTKAASMTGWTTGDNGIPDGWTVQDAQ